MIILSLLLAFVVSVVLEIPPLCQCFSVTTTKPSTSRSHRFVLADQAAPTTPSSVETIQTRTYTDWKDLDSSSREDAVNFAANLVCRRLESTDEEVHIVAPNEHHPNPAIIKDAFTDFACTLRGEQALESIFHCIHEDDDLELLLPAIRVVQSLCILGLRLGASATPSSPVEPRRRRNDAHAATRHCKRKADVLPGVGLLAALRRRQSPAGAVALLRELGAWGPHENLELLRSGIPLRFLDYELAAPVEDRDPDRLLGLRRDLTHMKVFAIDPVNAVELDDGVSLEPLDNGRSRIWIHVADADRWAPRGSELLEVARQRVTSVYMPSQTCSMFPPPVAVDVMSLREREDCLALSLGVELNDDGSIDEESIVVTPSTIRLTYKLTYQEVDEMLEEGIGYDEEWELGGLVQLAKKRRAFRIRQGSIEGKIAAKIPSDSIELVPDESASDKIRLQLRSDGSENGWIEAESSAHLLVSEAMILSGEAMGRWKMSLDRKRAAEERKITTPTFVNMLRVPFRSQTIDLNSQPRSVQKLRDLLEFNVGGGYCHAWFMRRFMGGGTVREDAAPHNGLGLDCYVQWSSPIRRFGDIQVHTVVKRFLRRNRIMELVDAGEKLPTFLDATMDLGLPDYIRDISQLPTVKDTELDRDVDFQEGGGYMGVTRRLQRRSEMYWMYEYIRRLTETDPKRSFSAVVLGCANLKNQQYAVYIDELGLESRYSAHGPLQPGDRIILNAQNIRPDTYSIQFIRCG